RRIVIKSNGCLGINNTVFFTIAHSTKTIIDYHYNLDYNKRRLFLNIVKLGGVNLMELKQLEYFMILCEELNFTRAAERIGIAQPSLIQQIILLEHVVGKPLFVLFAKKNFI